MRLYITALTLLTVFANLLSAKAHLSLSTDKDTYELGSVVKAVIMLEGTTIDPTPAGDIEPAFFFDSVEGPPALSYRYNFKTEEEGTHTIGPFSIKVGKEKIVSNSVTYTVVSYPKEGLTISVSNQTIPKGKEFLIVLISDIELKDPKLKENPLIEFKRMNTSQSSSYSSDGFIQEFTYEFVVESKKKGRLEISKSLFEELPDEVAILVAEVFIK